MINKEYSTVASEVKPELIETSAGNIPPATIQTIIAGRTGKIRAACPSCSTGKNDTALDINIQPNGTGVYNCHRCGLTGPVGAGSEKQWKPKPEYIWDKATTASPAHGYLVRKGIRVHGIRQDMHGNLVIPLYDSTGNIQTIQMIRPKKQSGKPQKFLCGPGKDAAGNEEKYSKKGASFQIGNVQDSEPVFFCEGFANAASLYESGLSPAVMCVDASNIAPVVDSYRLKYPDHQFILVSDNDRGKPETAPDYDTGFRKATEAARKVGNALVCLPPEPGQDVNDIYKDAGPDAVKALIKTAAPPAETTTPQEKKSQEEKISGLPASPAFEMQKNGRYKIYPEEDQLQAVMSAVFEALDRYNIPHKIFRSETGDILSEIIDGQARPITKDRLKYHLTHAMDWVKIVIQRKATVEKPVEISSTIIGQIFSQPCRFPLLRRVIPCPVFSASGKLHLTPGYDPETGFFLPEQSAFPFNRVPVQKARETLLEWLIDFPFDSEASRANAIAAAITPFVRAIVGEHPVPRMFFTAPIAGTGKGKLAGVLALPFLGKALIPKTECRNDDELEKAIVAEFIGSTPDFIFFDNLIKGVVSPKLAAWATTYRASGRVLGSSQSVTFPVNAPVWLMTANNPTLDKDNARRSLNIRIDAGVERPELRTGYKHPDPVAYTLKNREEINSALLSLCADWIDANKPDPVNIPLLGSFEKWSAVVGGILELAGFDSLMGNMQQFMEDCDEDTAGFKGLLELLEPGMKYKGKVLMMKIQDAGLESAFPDNVRSLGRALAKRKGQIFTVKGKSVRFERASESHGTTDWTIREVGFKVGLSRNPPENHPQKTQENQAIGGLGGLGGFHSMEKLPEARDYTEGGACVCEKGSIEKTTLTHLTHLNTENIDKNEGGYKVGFSNNPPETHLEKNCLNCHHYNARQRYCKKMDGGEIIAWQKCAGKNYQPVA